MLKKLLENLKQRKQEKHEIKLEKQRNKPEFTLGELYVGEIVLYKKSKYIGYGVYNNYFRPVKKVAFFTKHYSNYTHIKSGQILKEMDSCLSVENDYAIIDIKTFQEAFPIYMRKNNLTLKSKVSRAFIEESEDELNLKIDPNQKICELFK